MFVLNGVALSRNEDTVACVFLWWGGVVPCRAIYITVA